MVGSTSEQALVGVCHKMRFKRFAHVSSEHAGARAATDTLHAWLNDVVRHAMSLSGVACRGDVAHPVISRWRAQNVVCQPVSPCSWPASTTISATAGARPLAKAVVSGSCLMHDGGVQCCCGLCFSECNHSEASLSFLVLGKRSFEFGAAEPLLVFHVCAPWDMGVACGAEG